jgi:uncharacterized membrane protein
MKGIQLPTETVPVAIKEGSVSTKILSNVFQNLSKMVSGFTILIKIIMTVTIAFTMHAIAEIFFKCSTDFTNI